MPRRRPAPELEAPANLTLLEDTEEINDPTVLETRTRVRLRLKDGKLIDAVQIDHTTFAQIHPHNSPQFPQFSPSGRNIWIDQEQARRARTNKKHRGGGGAGTKAGIDILADTPPPGSATWDDLMTASNHGVTLE